MATTSSNPRKLTRLIPSGLRGAVIFAVVVGLLLPMLATFAVEQSISLQTARRQLEQDLDRTAKVLALAMQGQLWELSQENAEGIVRAMSDDERFNSVMVYDNINKQPFVEIHRRIEASGETRTAEHLIEQDGTVIGKVIVTMSLSPYLEINKKAQRWTMLRTSLMLGTALLLIILVLRRRLFRPIATLTEDAYRLAHEDFSRAIKLEHQDELGQVATAMEHMRQALVKAFAELHSKNDELSRHATSLEERVAERTQALSRANAELVNAMDTLQTTQAGLVESEKLASLGRLVAGVAHELNTPLGNAMTVVSTLEDQFAGFASALNSNALRKSDLVALVEATREGQSLLMRNIARAADLIRDFKQLAIDQTTEMRRKFDLAQVIREVLITIQPRFKATQFKIKVALSIDLMMDSYPGPLGQVLTNLVLNALLHGFENCSNGNILIESSPLGDDKVKITCSDDGVGMDPATVRKIFEPFFTTKLGQGGSGLGLHIVHTIVAGLLGGSIEVSSTLGQGTRFEITLPRVAPLRAQHGQARA